VPAALTLPMNVTARRYRDPNGWFRAARMVAVGREAPGGQINMTLLAHNEGATDGCRHKDRRARSTLE
jgi:hypothetical protein